MHVSRIFALGVLSAAAAALPASAGAAGWSHFSSAPLHLSVDYPAGWHTVYSPADKTEEFNVTKSEVIGVSYDGPAGRRTPAQLAASFAAHDVKRGWHLSRITNGSGQSWYTGVDKAGVHQTQFVVERGGNLYSIFAIAFAKTYNTDNQYATHMAASLTAR